MRRRRFLAGGTVLFSVPLAGCGHPPVVLDMDAVTSTEITAAVSETADPGSEAYHVLTAAIENGSATRTGLSALFDGTRTVRVEDRFSEVTETRVASSEVKMYDVLIDLNPSETTPELGVIDYTDLPAVDRQRLVSILAERDSPTGEGYDVGVDYGTAESVGNGSVFVPDQQYDILVRRSERYRIGVERRTTTESQYRYEVSEIAPDVETYADQLREQYRFELTARSTEERDVIEAAIDGGYFTDSDAARWSTASADTTDLRSRSSTARGYFGTKALIISPTPSGDPRRRTRSRASVCADLNESWKCRFG
jgi:hypothetical protein